VLTQFNSSSLNSHIKNTYNFSIFSKGFVDILAAEQTNDGDKWFEGTADAVRRSFRKLASIDYDYVLILSGDQLYQMDFDALVDFHVENEGDLTIATIPVNAKDATGFGILKSDEKNHITSFIEKPNSELLVDWSSEVSDHLKGEGREYLASMGIYVFSKGVLKRMLEENRGMDFGKEIIPDAIDTHRVLSYQFEGYWTDIGTIGSFYEANIGLTDNIPAFNLFDKNTVFTRPRMLPPSKISGTTLINSVISDGCIIQADKIDRSVVGVRSRIGTGSVVRGTYMMGSDYYEDLVDMEDAKRKNIPVVGVGERCYIENAILDKNCRIGNDVRINGGPHLLNANHPTYTICDGIVVIKKNAVIPNGTTIGLTSL
jgi:glucose-1-phosphate adenylyltransferase